MFHSLDLCGLTAKGAVDRDKWGMGGSGGGKSQ